jgi:uncharacterized protein (TIGR03084 family)
MEKITADLAAQHAELRGILTGLSDEQWASPSLCSGWSIADVVLHLAQSDEVALGSARGTMEVAARNAGWDLGSPGSAIEDNADAAVAKQRGASPADLFARWSAAADGLVATLAITDPKRMLPWVANDLPARTLATTRLAECWIHTHDIARPLGIAMEPADRWWHIVRLAWRTLPYAFAQAGQALTGPVALILDKPDGTGTWEFVEGEPLTTVRGPAETFLYVAARRVPGLESDLEASGPDADAVLELVRTFA